MKHLTTFVCIICFVILPSAEAQTKKQLPKKLSVATEAAWKQLDAEGRWVLFKTTIQKDPLLLDAWAAFVTARKDSQFLEWIAIYQLNTLRARKALVDVDAPQWPRVTIWVFGTPNTHGAESAELTLLKRRPRESWSWLQKYPELANSARLKRSFAVLKNMKLKPVEVKKYLPPLKAEQVFLYLTPPKTLVDFGDRKRAQPGEVYVHQVERAIDGLIVSGIRTKEWLDRLTALTKHPNVVVRRAAFLSFTHISAPQIPLQVVRAAIDDPKEEKTVRDAALLAFSFGNHPQVYVRLHEIAATPKHAAWRATISRLGDLGDEFTVSQLNQVEEFLTGSDQQFFIEREQERILKRLKGQTVANIRVRLTSMLEVSAWAAMQDSPLHPSLEKKMLAIIRVHRTNSKIQKLLKQIHTGYKKSVGDAKTDREFQNRVRELAEQLLDE